jgi:hypothetical protein
MALVSRLVGRMAPSGQKLWSLETRLVPEKASIEPREFRGRSDLVRLYRSKERRILWCACSLARISRERGLSSIWRKSRIAVLGLIAATSVFLQILRRQSLQFYCALTHQTSLRQSQPPVTHTGSNLGEILDALGGLPGVPIQPQELKEYRANPFGDIRPASKEEATLESLEPSWPNANDRTSDGPKS